MHHRFIAHAAACLALACGAASAGAAPISILFLGNSYTFGRVDPVMSYNAANVHDLTAGFNAISSTGSTGRWAARRAPVLWVMPRRCCT